MFPIGAKVSFNNWKQKGTKNKYFVYKRGKLDGAGEWTHLYSDIGNTSCSKDTRISENYTIQWVGGPGPEKIPDRHHRSMAPLYKNGRVMMIGLDYIYCVDAYNGIIIWEKKIKDLIRLVVLKDCGNATLADNFLYIAAGKKCHVLDVKTGKTVKSFIVPQNGFEWGYIAYDKNILLGSLCKTGTIRRKQTAWNVNNITHRDYTPIICSDGLFVMDRHFGKLLWEYNSTKGVIINPTITAGDGIVYFIESANLATKTMKNRNIKLSDLLKNGLNIVGLNMKTGKVVLNKKTNIKDLEHHIYLLYANKKLILSGTKNLEKKGTYILRGFDAKNGEKIWEIIPKDTVKPNGSHGEQDQHPVIINNKLYIVSCIIDINTGKKITDSTDPWRVKYRGVKRNSGGCGTVSASENFLFFRSYSLIMLNLINKSIKQFGEEIRPGCWINIIPVGGLIIMPEGSSGCTCRHYTIQSSIAFLPEKSSEQ